jgi:hypothetical protein
MHRAAPLKCLDAAYRLRRNKSIRGLIMARFGAIVAGLILAVMAVAPASANTIQTFNLNGVKFNDGGTATGSFTLDLTTHTVVSSSIFTSFKNLVFVGGDYNGSFVDSFTASPSAQVKLGDWAIPFVSGQLLTLNFGLTDLTDLSAVTSFVLSGSEKVYSWLCWGGLCGTRKIVAGTADIATTPIPATLPLLATALAGMGFVGWRRKRQTASA